MSVQLYISGEAPRRFTTQAEFVLWVRTRWIDPDSAVAPASSGVAPQPRTEGASGVAGHVSASAGLIGPVTPPDEVQVPHVITLMEALEASLAAVKANRPPAVNEEPAVRAAATARKQV